MRRFKKIESVPQTGMFTTKEDPSFNYSYGVIHRMAGIAKYAEEAIPMEGWVEIMQDHNLLNRNKSVITKYLDWFKEYCPTAILFHEDPEELDMDAVHSFLDQEHTPTEIAHGSDPKEPTGFVEVFGFRYSFKVLHRMEKIMKASPGLTRAGHMKTLQAHDILKGNEWALNMYLDYIEQGNVEPEPLADTTAKAVRYNYFWLSVEVLRDIQQLVRDHEDLPRTRLEDLVKTEGYLNRSDYWIGLYVTYLMEREGVTFPPEHEKEVRASSVRNPLISKIMSDIMGLD